MVDPARSVTGERPIRVFILDDHELVRRGLTDLLTATDDLIIVGEAATAMDALHRIPAAAPDVALLDARLPDGSGIDVCRDIRSSQENVRCLILTSVDDDEALCAAVMAAWIVGYEPGTCSVEASAALEVIAPRTRACAATAAGDSIQHFRDLMFFLPR